MNIYIFGFLLISIILQTNILPSLFYAEIKPDFFLGITLYASLFLDSSKGITCGLISGMLLDIFTEGKIGPNTFALMTVAIIVVYIRNYVIIENILTQSLLISVSTFYQWSLIFIYRRSFYFNQGVFLESAYFILVQTLLNLIFSFLLFILFNLLKRKQTFKI